MTKYPLVIRNRVAWFYRGFIVAWLIGLSLGTYAALRDAPPIPGKWWPIILLLFWVAGLFALRWSLNQETSVVRIMDGHNIHIQREKAFRRKEHRTSSAHFWIEDTQDSEGDPYFKLMMDAPGGPLSVREGHHRMSLETLHADVEAALRSQT